MSKFSSIQKVDFKISQPNTLFLIGSNSIHSSGDLYMMDMNTINKVKNIRSKRLFDFSSSVVLLCSFPLLFFFMKTPLNGLKSSIKVLLGLATWVGYCDGSSFEKLPKLKKNILSISDGLKSVNAETSSKLNIIYAKDYSVFADLRVLLRNLRNID